MKGASVQTYSDFVVDIDGDMEVTSPVPYNMRSKKVQAEPTKPLNHKRGASGSATAELQGPTSCSLKRQRKQASPPPAQPASKRPKQQAGACAKPPVKQTSQEATPTCHQQSPSRQQQQQQHSLSATAPSNQKCATITARPHTRRQAQHLALQRRGRSTRRRNAKATFTAAKKPGVLAVGHPCLSASRLPECTLRSGSPPDPSPAPVDNSQPSSSPQPKPQSRSAPRRRLTASPSTRAASSARLPGSPPAQAALQAASPCPPVRTRTASPHQPTTPPTLAKRSGSRSRSRSAQQRLSPASLQQRREDRAATNTPARPDDLSPQRLLQALPPVVATWFDPTDPEKVRAVARALSAEGGTAPVGREAELAQLQAFLTRHLAAGRGASAYISGTPGIGKSLTMEALVRWAVQQRAPGGSRCPGPLSAVLLNCMALNPPRSVFACILQGLHAAAEPGSRGRIIRPEPAAATSDPDKALYKLQAALRAPAGGKGGGRRKGGQAQQGMVLVVLDELDNLMAGAGKQGGGAGGGRQAVLGQLFALAHAPGSRLLLIGVANSLNLVSQCHLDLQSQVAGCVPEVLAFKPYSWRQLAAILTARLSTLPGPVYAPKAIELCAKKIANATGDIRLALAACKAALDTVVAAAAPARAAPAAADDAGEWDFGPLLDEAGRPVILEQEVQQPPVARRPVSIGDMSAAVAGVTGGSGAACHAVNVIRGLPAQQQLALVATARLIGNAAPAAHPASSAVQEEAPLQPGYVRLRKEDAEAMAAPPGSALARARRRSSVSGASCSSAPAFSASRRSSAASQGRPARLRCCPLAKLHDQYCALCKRVGLRAHNDAEFAVMCSTLQDQGLLRVKAGHGQRNDYLHRRVTLPLQPDLLRLALQDTRLFDGLLAS